jgi:hypothetical protein
MTEVDWDITEEPASLLSALRNSASQRKLRLFGILCCRQAWDFVTEPAPDRVLDAAERYADGALAESERCVAETEALDAYERELERGDEFGLPVMDVVRLIGKAVYTADDATGVASYVPVLARYGERASFQGISEDLQVEQCLYIRELFRNPFRPVSFSPEWRTDTAVLLARQMYEARDFSAMPILADALQDAGCDNADILSHCRDTSLAHVRGCWVIDLVLNKA